MQYKRAMIAVQNVSYRYRTDLPCVHADAEGQEVTVLWSEGQGDKALSHTSQIIGAEMRHNLTEQWVNTPTELKTAGGSHSAGTFRYSWSAPRYFVVYYR